MLLKTRCGEFHCHFGRMDDDKVVIPFVTCVKCSSVLSYNTDKGTGRAGPGLLMNRPELARLYK